MIDPYRAPASSSAASATDRGSKVANIYFGFGIVCALLAALVPTLVIPSFALVYQSFGPTLPFATRLLLAVYPYYWLLPIAVVVLGLRRSGASAFTVGLAGLIIVFLFTVVAAYLPTFALGAVV